MLPEEKGHDRSIRLLCAALDSDFAFSADDVLFVDDDGVSLVRVDKVFRILYGGAHLSGIRADGTPPPVGT